MPTDNSGVAWSGEEKGAGRNEGEGRGRVTLRERKRKSNWSSLISGAGIMVQLVWRSLLFLCHGDWGVTNGRLTCNGSPFSESCIMPADGSISGI